ncbi:hypothetical protein ACVWW6_009092 [Bradyrhizobium sp. USDA 3311]
MLGKIVGVLLFSMICFECANAQVCGNSIATQEIRVVGSCSNGNPMLGIKNSTASATNVKYCVEQRAPGYASRDFKNVSVGPDATVQLGCKVENGYTQRFSVHWEGSVCNPPINITDAASAIEIVNTGGGPYLLRNHHHFKSVQVFYYGLKGNLESITVRPHDSEVAYGPHAGSPTITQIAYTVPYPDSASCVTPLDQYPSPLPIATSRKRR